MHPLSRKQRNLLFRILCAAILLIFAALMPAHGILERAFFLLPYLIAGWDVLYKAIRNLRNRQIFDENFLMSLATVGAFATGEYAEAVFVMIFYQTGELFQDYAVGRSRASIAALMDIRPDIAHVEQENGALEDQDPEDVEAGTIFIVKPGERVPLDGVILEGESALNTAALTGEPLPRDVAPGDTVLSGSVNQSGLLRIRASCAGTESTAARILELVENAGEKRAASEQFITRFARYYTPCVVGAAVFLALIPPLMVGNWGVWFHRALLFLVVSCPCALVISVPLSFFGGIGGASRLGILFKGGSYLEALAKTETAAFDKTGTLTQGVFAVTGTEAAERFDPRQILEAAALAESFSSHPIALSLRAAYEETLPLYARPNHADHADKANRADHAGGDANDTDKADDASGNHADKPDGAGLALIYPGHTVTDVEELAGFGVQAVVDGREICVGSRRLMERRNLTIPETESAAVYVSINGVYVGRILIADLPKA